MLIDRIDRNDKAFGTSNNHCALRVKRFSSVWMWRYTERRTKCVRSVESAAWIVLEPSSVSCWLATSWCQSLERYVFISGSKRKQNAHNSHVFIKQTLP